MAKLGYVHLNTEYATETHLPAGEYVVQVIKSEIVPTKNGDGELLKLQVQVIEGPHANRMFFPQFNIHNPNPVAADIGRKEFGHITKALGIDAIEDAEEVHGKPFIAKVGVEPEKRENGKTYPAKNFLQGAKPYGATAQKEPQSRPLAPTASQHQSRAPAVGVSAGVATAEATVAHAANNGAMQALQALGRTQRKTPF